MGILWIIIYVILLVANLGLGVKAIADGKPERGYINWFAATFMILMSFVINWSTFLN